jgi:hypothetical protein
MSDHAVGRPKETTRHHHQTMRHRLEYHVWGTLKVGRHQKKIILLQQLSHFPLTPCAKKPYMVSEAGALNLSTSRIELSSRAHHCHVKRNAGIGETRQHVQQPRKVLLLFHAPHVDQSKRVRSHLTPSPGGGDFNALRYGG